MEFFINDNFLLRNETARRLYHDYAKGLPVIDYHCHLPPAQIAENACFENLTAIWLAGDHYKWRAMRAFGVPEKYITGNASDEEKFLQWAAVTPYTIRNPLYHWTHMELKDPFGIAELLNEKNAKKVYDRCNTLLQQPGYTPRGLLEHFKVQMVGTTDDPLSDLHYHCQLSKEKLPVKILPTFRPDKALNISGGKAFTDYLKQLSAVSGVEIKNTDTLLEALSKRVDHFHAHGGRASDHGFAALPSRFEWQPQYEEAFRKILAGAEAVDVSEWAENFRGYILLEMCKIYHAKGWIQQFHIGAIRNNNSRMAGLIGADAGFDSIGDELQAELMARFFDKLDSTDQLAKTIVYNLNPAENEVFAAMMGNFSSEGVKCKMQYGSAWWFLDQKEGIERQLNTLSNMGLISCFIGMITDSRSFLSYSRHDYFRRLLCNLFGKDVEEGLLPGDIPWLGKMVQDICYYNAKDYFSFTL